MGIFANIIDKKHDKHSMVDSRYTINIHRTLSYCILSCKYFSSDQKGIKNKDTEDYSVRFLVVLIIGLFLWAIYGLGRTDIVIIIGNTIGVSLNICMLGLKFKYSRRPLEKVKVNF